MNIAASYLEDAKAQLSLAGAVAKDESTPPEQWQAVLLAAIGIEKLLKYVLAKTNPALVLKTIDYESTVIACHIDQVTATEKVAELRKKAAADVVTLKTAVQRASLFSTAVRNHSQFIHALADMRDIAAHRPWIEAEPARVRIMVCRDLYAAIADISKSLDLDPAVFFQGHAVRLFQLSEQVTAEENLNAQMASLLAQHKAKWEERKGKPSLVEGAQKITIARLAAEPYVADCKCPACGNDALAVLEPDIDYDYDQEDGTAYATVIGVSVERIQCFYCSLLLDKYDQLRYVNADALLAGGGEF
jgi:hypothetical protein